MTWHIESETPRPAHDMQFETIAADLARALRLTRCRCQGKWIKGAWERNLDTPVCGKCVTLARYETLRAVKSAHVNDA